MAGIWNKLAQGQRLYQQKQMNALKMDEYNRGVERDQQMRDVLSEAVTPSRPAMPQAEAMGPVPMGGAPLPDYPAQEFRPAEMNMQNALGAMYESGLGPEAMELEAKQRTLRGATPSMVNEYKFWEQLPPADQEKYLAVKRAAQIKKIGGVETVVSPISGTKQLGTLEGETKARGELKKAEVIGAESAKIAGKAFEQSQKINKNIVNLREVIRLVGDGAETGPLTSKLPSFRAASVELDNMRNRLGLDVIGAVTFGALSKGELDLALDTALPTNLDGPELVAWANDKIAAQEKLSKYFSDQSIYLSKQGNTPASWLERQQAPQADQSDKAAFKWAAQNPNDPRAMKILQMQGTK